MNNFLNLIEWINEDTAGGMVGAMTSAGNPSVAYLPGGFTTTKNMLRSLNPVKKKWKLTVEEDKENYKVGIEDAMDIVIPRQHYEHFNKNVYNLSGKNILDLTEMLNESKEEELKAAYNRLHQVLVVDLKENPKVRQLLILMNQWLNEFPISRFLQQRADISLNGFIRNIEKIFNTIKNLYGDDLGKLEMLLDSLETNQPISSFEPFNKSNGYLIGVSIDSEYEGVTLKIDLYLTHSMILFQNIYIDSKEVLAELGAYKSVKVAGQYVYPVEENFSPSIFRNLKDIIDNLEEK